MEFDREAQIVFLACYDYGPLFMCDEVAASRDKILWILFGTI